MGVSVAFRHYDPLYGLWPRRIDAQVFGVARSYDMAG
jgi:hypothetical protein